MWGLDILVLPEVVHFRTDEEAEIPCGDSEEDFVACAVQRLVFVAVNLGLCKWVGF